MVVTNLDILRVNEGMLAILLAGGIEAQKAAWAIDALSLYICAYTLEQALVARRISQEDEGLFISREEQNELVRRFSALPADQFPNTRRYAAELTSGRGHKRFDFTIRLIIENIK